MNDTLTVGDLKKILANFPDDRTVWVFNPDTGMHQSVNGVTDDKRSKAVNLWVDGVDKF